VYGGRVATPSLSGRRAEALRNDERVLRAAREVLTAMPNASMADVARHAGVGMGTLYRRYPSKEALVHELCLDGMRALEAVADDALDRVKDDAWGAFAGFMAGSLAAGAGSLGRLAGTFAPDRELIDVSQRLYRAVQKLLDTVQAAGAVRDDVTVGDVNLLFEQLRAIHLRDEERLATLQSRYLTLVLQALRAPGAGPLPGPPPAWGEIQRRWTD
jgi:AcrR family transcriptional regulator